MLGNIELVGPHDAVPGGHEKDLVLAVTVEGDPVDG